MLNDITSGNVTRYRVAYNDLELYNRHRLQCNHLHTGLEKEY
jgi:hypothetical protein